MHGCESWTVKKAGRRRIYDFELWPWRTLLRVPWTARRSNQSILKEISPGCSLEGLMLKLKLQYFGHLMRRVDSLEETLMLGGIGGRRRRGDRGWDGWMASPTWWTCVWVNSRSWWWTGRPGVLWFMGSQRVGHNWATELNWTELKITADGDCSHESKRHLLLGRKAMTNLDSILKCRDITLLTKVHIVKAMVFPVVMYRCELNLKECWTPKNWCFWTVMVEKTLQSPLDSTEIKLVNPKGN